MAKNRPENPLDEEAPSRRPADAAGDAGSRLAEAAPLSFEDALARLEAIVHELEEGRVGLAEALARYEEGVALLRRCHDLLERAERRIELLRGVDAKRQPITTPYDDDPTSLEEKAAERSQRRSAGDSPSKPRKSARPPKSRPAAGEESPEPRDRGAANLFGEEETPDDSDIRF